METTSIRGLNHAFGAGGDIMGWQELPSYPSRADMLSFLGLVGGSLVDQLREPLTVSTAAAELLVNTSDDQELQRTCARKILITLSEAGEILDRLPHVDRVLDEEPVPLNINELLEEAAILIAHEVDQRRLVVRKSLSRGAVVEGKRGLLQQIFIGILQAICSTMSCGDVLSLGTTLEERKVQVRIRYTSPVTLKRDDTGGFESSLGDAASDGRSGPVLSLAARIVESQGGRIWAVAEPEGESSVVLELPAPLQAATAVGMRLRSSSGAPLS